MHKKYPTVGIYKAEIASCYYNTEEDEKRYCYIKPAKGVNPEALMADCWIVDLDGRVNPNTALTTVYISKEAIGRRVA